ncbi:LTV1-like [Homarus americanus]|uniref:Protein LTV1 homolog n=1 Tax=Homarus americanus TaxID=6706 RepID=A0A8J5K508_HOMAM|nr:LTV1-like [Homarus americanus]
MGIRLEALTDLIGSLWTGKKGKRFIDKRRDVLHTFKVVPRSQRDPLVTDETAPQAVLQPSEDNSKKTELEKFGIFFDDDYNYLQHLRGVREAVNWDEEELEVYTIRREDPQMGKKELRGKKLLLPSSAFESFVEEPIGLLNKAAPVTGPRPELDPDVVAGLDDDFFEETAVCNPDDDGALPDNFVVMLNSENPVNEFEEDDGEWEDCEEDEDIWGNCGDEDGEMPALEDLNNGLHAYREKAQDEGYDADEEERDFSSDFNDSDDEARDDLCSLDGPSRTFRDEETKSHFTNYSLSSSILRRNDLLTKLDDCFEEKFIREYQDEHVGALDGEDIDGFVGEESPLFQQVLEQTHKQLQEDTEDDRTRIIKWIKDMQDRRVNMKEEKDEERRIEKKLNRAAFKDEKKRQEKILMNNKYNSKISMV